MTERTGVVTFRGNPVTLLGPEIAVGDRAPDFTALGSNLAPVRFSELGGTRVISVVPSLETPVCDLQTRRFNESLARLGEASVLTVSVDLPFAQARWCGAAGVEGVRTLSDHRDLSFGLAYGVVIKEFRLLARAVFVVDAAGTVVHAEYVPEVGQEPNFDAAIVAAQGAETARRSDGRAA
ncbi:thiol peroxidase [Amycolatopsis sp. Hca4]|uniref:thiol peroxidase n=1 Tax=unclassified Amycolatopsis TaxID=2618356 RepID=UPI000CA35B7C|nr:thiol peroxidase [Amycolatopsis sp. Hca4]ATV95618.1 thiol peroxidase [Amycolatopsis sp.]QKV75110.1 thiol peroxidase [Amycolatopsis sp. Hca4]